MVTLALLSARVKVTYEPPGTFWRFERRPSPAQPAQRLPLGAQRPGQGGGCRWFRQLRAGRQLGVGALVAATDVDISGHDLLVSSVVGCGNDDPVDGQVVAKGAEPGGG